MLRFPLILGGAFSCWETGTSLKLNTEFETFKGSNTYHLQFSGLRNNTNNELENVVLKHENSDSGSECIFFNENTCEVILNQEGRYFIQDSNDSIINFNHENNEAARRKIRFEQTAATRDQKTATRKRRSLSTRSERSIDDTSWLPEISSIYPAWLAADRAGERVEIYGTDLFPRNSEIMSGKLIEIYFEPTEGETNPDWLAREYPCEINTYWSNNDRLVCDTVEMPKTSNGQGIYIRIRYFDAASNKMVEITSIHPSAYHNCDSNCKIYTSTSSNNRIEFFGNRFTNGGKNDAKSSFYTEWFSRRDMRGDTSWKLSRKDLDPIIRPKNCDYPVGIEVQYEGVAVETINDLFWTHKPNVIYKNWEHASDIWEVDPSSNWTVANDPADLQFRYKCDRNVQTLYGYFKDQNLPSSDSPTEGITIPKLVSASDSTKIVGTCALNYENSELDINQLPSDMTKDRTAHEATIFCRTESDSSYHGGAVFSIRSDNGAEFIGSPRDDNWEMSTVWLMTNKLDALYQTYISPAITEISTENTGNRGSKNGGYEITITGNKFGDSSSVNDISVKVGFENCEIISLSKTQIVCKIKSSSSGSLNSDCADSSEFPGNPGFRILAVDGTHFGHLTETDRNRERDSRYMHESNTEDGFFQITPRRYGYGDHGWNTKDWYSLVMDGFFVAPRTGYYSFVTSGDDRTHWFYNQNNKTCPMQKTENFENQGALLMEHTGAVAPSEISQSSQVSEQFYLQKDEMMFMKGGFFEGGGNDYSQVGAIYSEFKNLCSAPKFLN